jgi:hypothetical protein
MTVLRCISGFELISSVAEVSGGTSHGESWFRLGTEPEVCLLDAVALLAWADSCKTDTHCYNSLGTLSAEAHCYSKLSKWSTDQTLPTVTYSDTAEKKFPAFMEPKRSSLCSQKPAFGTYHEKAKHSPHLCTLFSHLDMLRPRLFSFSVWSPPLEFTNNKLCILHFSTHILCLTHLNLFDLTFIACVLWRKYGTAGCATHWHTARSLSQEIQCPTPI